MPYSERSNIEDIYGVTNVEKWADLDNDGDATKITNRITAAITRADDELDNRLRESRYVVPFTTVPSAIEYLSALYAGIWLYSNRGVTDYNADGEAQDQLQHQRNDFDEKVRMIHAGTYILDVSSSVKTYPQVIK